MPLRIVVTWRMDRYFARITAGAAFLVLPFLPQLAAELPPLVFPLPEGRVINVPAGGDLQQALDEVRTGETIVLEAGAVFTGNFKVPARTDDSDGWITVVSSEIARLPPAGTRVKPENAAQMPKIVTANTLPALSFLPGSHHWRFAGVEITGTHAERRTTLTNLVLIGYDAAGALPLGSVAEMPHHVAFERSFLHGTPAGNVRRGIALNGADLSVVDSRLSDFHEVGADSQALAGWNGPGPIKIINNYLEAAGENILFGGADPRVPDLVPSDIEIRGNHFSKPLSWRIGDPGYAGVPWTVKNLLELKNARRVLIDGNVFENNWVHGQSGFAVLFTVRNQSGGAPWSVVEDVAFTDNIVRNSARGIHILGRDNNFPSEQAGRIHIKNNSFELDAESWGGGCCNGLFLIGGGPRDVVFEENTSSHSGNIITVEGEPVPGFAFRKNALPHNAFGVFGAGAGIGNPAIERYFPGAVFEGNAIIGGNPANYPSGNFFPQESAGVPEGIGADLALINAKTTSDAQSGPSPTPEN